MKKLFTSLMMLTIAALVGCGEKSIEGEYKGGGQVGIYKMDILTIKKTNENSKYNIQFSGSSKILKYENVEFKDSILKINDKGFMMPIKIQGNKATLTDSGVVFEKTK